MRLLLVLLVMLACGCGRDRGAPPPGMRLVSLTPSATEVVAALGATGQLVGVDEFSRFPPEVAALPKVGSFLSPNLEAIIRLAPTLVIVDDIHGSAAKVLGDAQVPTVACAMHTLADIERALRDVGARIGRAAEAERAVQGITRTVEAARVQRAGNGVRVLAIIDREVGGLSGLVAAGPGSWVDELLGIVGAQNVLASTSARYPKLSVEEVLRAQPDVILDLTFSGKAGIEPWQRVDVPAVKTGRVIALQAQPLVAPSPRVEEAIVALASALSTRPRQ